MKNPILYILLLLLGVTIGLGAGYIMFKPQNVTVVKTFKDYRGDVERVVEETRSYQ